MSIMTIKTPAKLNLGLQVGHQRSDGFHEIRTVYQTINLFDRVTVQRSSCSSDKLIVTGDSDLIPSGRKNVVLRTLETLRRYGVEVPPLVIELEKTIPSKKGLGGGSSDAAALLRIVNDSVMEGDINYEVIQKVAREIGSDVPFFLLGGTVKGTGRGVKLEPLEDLKAQVLLVIPPYSVSTKEAYHSLNRLRDKFEPIIPDSFPARNETGWNKLSLSNDFSFLVESEQKLHRKLTEALGNYTEYFGLTGTGSALFALFGSSKELNFVRNQLSDRFKEVELYSLKFLTSKDLPTAEKVASPAPN